MQISKIIRRRQDSFTLIGNGVLRDNKLSLKAKGLFSLVISLPDGWDFSIAGLTTLIPEGQTAVYSALKELIEAGYVRRDYIREKGKRVGVQYTFNEQGSCSLPLEVLNLEDLNLENQQQINKDINKERFKEEETRPALRIYQEFFPKSDRLFPNQVQAIVDTVKDDSLWVQTCRLWSLKGYRSNNIPGLLDVYTQYVHKSANQLAAVVPQINDPCPYCSVGKECPLIQGGVCTW